MTLTAVWRFRKVPNPGRLGGLFQWATKREPALPEEPMVEGIVVREALGRGQVGTWWSGAESVVTPRARGSSGF